MDDVSRDLGLKVVTEVMDPYDIEMVMEHAQVLQIGARNMANFSLLKRSALLSRARTTASF